MELPFYLDILPSAEQRRSAWITFESYAYFLDPANPNLIHEGYPAPWRLYVRAREKWYPRHSCLFSTG